MKRVVSFGLVILGVAAAGCGNNSKKPAGPNPIDQVMAPRYAKEGIVPVEASRPELCRRIAADLIGRYPTLDEVKGSLCAGSPDDMVSRMQGMKEHDRVSERIWRDRFDSTDVNVDWRYLKDLFKKVDDMEHGKIGYREFAIEAMSHPGFIMQVFQPEDKVKAVFKAFMGRAATSTESADLAGLYRPWLPVQEPDPNFSYTYRVTSSIFPLLCEPISDCTATMLGGGQLDLSAFSDPQFQGIKYDTLNAAQLDALREPGRVLTSQPFFYEAAADAILSNYLGWSDGGRFPREPGIVLPEVREVLADYIRTHNNYRDAERVVMTSWLYRAAEQVPDDGFGDDPAGPVPAIYAHGPTKAGVAEVWLDSTSALTTSLGDCDQRYADGFGYFFIQQALQQGLITQTQATADMKTLHDLREDRVPWDDTNGFPDFTYVYVARLIGGCPGFGAQRQIPNGLSYAFTQESLAELLCDNTVAQNLTPPPSNSAPTLDTILSHQMAFSFGREPSSQDQSDFATAKANCSGNDCTVPGMENAVCVGLLGSAEMVFY